MNYFYQAYLLLGQVYIVACSLPYDVSGNVATIMSVVGFQNISLTLLPLFPYALLSQEPLLTKNLTESPLWSKFLGVTTKQSRSQFQLRTRNLALFTFQVLNHQVLKHVKVPADGMSGLDRWAFLWYLRRDLQEQMSMMISLAHTEHCPRMKTKARSYGGKRRGKKHSKLWMRGIRERAESFAHDPLAASDWRLHHDWDRRP